MFLQQGYCCADWIIVLYLTLLFLGLCRLESKIMCPITCRVLQDIRRITWGSSSESFIEQMLLFCLFCSAHRPTLLWRLMLIMSIVYTLLKRLLLVMSIVHTLLKLLLLVMSIVRTLLKWLWVLMSIVVHY